MQKGTLCVAGLGNSKFLMAERCCEGNVGAFRGLQFQRHECDKSPSHARARALLRTRGGCASRGART